LIVTNLDLCDSRADVSLAFAGGCGGVADRENRASLLQFGIDYGGEKCYRTGVSVSFVFCKKLPLSSIKRRNDGSYYKLLVITTGDSTHTWKDLELEYKILLKVLF
jgi:hypothetical protein